MGKALEEQVKALEDKIADNKKAIKQYSDKIAENNKNMAEYKKQRCDANFNYITLLREHYDSEDMLKQLKKRPRRLPRQKNRPPQRRIHQITYLIHPKSYCLRTFDPLRTSNFFDRNHASC